MDCREGFNDTSEAHLKSRIKMFRLLLKTIWKKGIPIPGGYIMEKVCYTKKREVPVRTPPEGKEYNANRACLNS